MSANSASDALVSVVIPVYGTARFVAQALDSVFAQTYPHFEVIVVNDGSPDSSLLEKELEPYRGRIIYIVQENRGAAAARNVAIRAGHGRYVAILDSDDYWHPDYLASQISVLAADPSIDVVFPDAMRVSADGNRARRMSESAPFRGEISVRRLLADESLVYGGVTARRDTFLRVGLYDESLRNGEDLDLWLRILKAGGRIVYNDKVLAYYRARDDSLTSTAVPAAVNSLKLLANLPNKVTLTPEERAVLDQRRARIVGTLARAEAKQAFLSGDTRTALRKLGKASEHERSVKLVATMVGLRVAPGLLRGLYNFREWLHGMLIRAQLIRSTGHHP